VLFVQQLHGDGDNRNTTVTAVTGTKVMVILQ